MASAAPSETRTQGGRIAKLFCRPRTQYRAACAAAIAVAGFAWTPVAAQADFGIVPGSTTVTALNQNGTIDTQAGSHPYSFTVHFDLNQGEDGKTEGGAMRDVFVKLPPGFIGNPRAIPACPQQEFEGGTPSCPPSTQVGVLRANVNGLGQIVGPVYNLVPPPGQTNEFGFSNAAELTSLQFASLRTDEGYGLGFSVPNIPVEVTSVTETIWGTPADPGHTPERGRATPGDTPSTAPQRAFLTTPASCDAAPETTLEVDSKLAPGVFASETVHAIDAGGHPAPMSGCDGVPFAPKISAQPTSRLAESPSGLEFELKLPNQGLLSPGGIAETEPRKTVVTLPEGLTVNPSLAEGVGVCSEAQYKAEKIDSPAAAGCPPASRLGSVIAQTPLLDEPALGSVYLAAPYDNPFGTLAALYLVARAPERGILVKQAGKVEFDPSTAQITTTFEGLPPAPYSSFKLSFKEGARAPLATPAACGEYKTTATFAPFSAKDDTEAITTTGSFQIERGADGGPCPSGGLPPFHPGLIAGTLNAGAGQFSPFYVDLNRTDTEQEITHFSIKLPPGLVAKLAGVPFCTDAEIAAAAARTGPHGGAEEIASPSCPAASEIGHSLAGAGVGSALAYAPGKLYLAGPYHGSALSLVAITAAKVGPFDLGTVLVRLAFKVNPETGEVFLDSTGSDPLPHILQGVPVHLRDIIANTDRPEFVLNPTSCKQTSTASTLLGSGLDFTSPADDNPFVASSPFQAVNCAKLPFAPKLTLRLSGAHRRTGNPALHAHLAMNGFGEAGVAYTQLTLPGSEFLDNSHIGTVCTRVQFKQGAIEGEKCPAGSLIGHAKALTPILAEPLEGSVYLRSNPERKLPDVVAALHGSEISVNLVGHVDSDPKTHGLRTTFEVVPDAPVTSFDIDLLGGRRGLLKNSTDLCLGRHIAKAAFKGQNGKRASYGVALRASCGKGKRRK